MRKKETGKEALPELHQLREELSREKHRKQYKRILRSTIYTLIVVAAAAVLVATLWMPVLRMYGASMEPTLSEGDIVISVKGDQFEQGDLIAFYLGNKLLVKRCIAGPGQWVDIDEFGNVSVDGKPLSEPYVSEKALGDCNIELPYQVPEERWFLLGDRRTTSVDSRNTAVGCVGEDQIVGKIVYRVWPVKNIGTLKEG